MVNIERSKLNQAMYQKLKKYIMNKRKQELEEMKQVAYYKKLKKEKEERKRQVEIDTENLEKLKKEINSTKEKLDDLKVQKSRLFQLFKEKANEENQLKEKHKREQAAQLALHGTQFGPTSHHAPATHPAAQTGHAQLYINQTGSGHPHSASQSQQPSQTHNAAAVAAMSLLQQASSVAGTGGLPRVFGGQGGGQTGGAPVSQFQAVQQAAQQGVHTSQAAAVAHAQAQKMIMVCNVPTQQTSTSGTKRPRSPSPVSVSSCGGSSQAYHLSSSSQAFKVSASMGGGVKGGIVSAAGSAGQGAYGGKMPVVYTQVGSGQQPLYMDRNSSGQSVVSTSGGLSGLPSDVDAHSLAAAAVAMTKYKYLPTGYNHSAASAATLGQNYRQSQSMMDGMKNVAAVVAAAAAANSAISGGGAGGSSAGGGGLGGYAKSHLPPAGTSYRGSITTGQSAQQIQMQAQLQQVAAHQQAAHQQAAQQAAHQQAQHHQQQQIHLQQQFMVLQAQAQVAAAAAAVQQQQQQAAAQQQQQQQAAAQQHSPKGQGAVGSQAGPGVPYGVSAPGHLSGVQGYPAMATTAYQVYNQQQNSYPGQQPPRRGFR